MTEAEREQIVKNEQEAWAEYQVIVRSLLAAIEGGTFSETLSQECDTAHNRWLAAFNLRFPEKKDADSSV